MFPTLKSGQTFVGLKTKKIGVGDVVIVKANKNLESSLCFVSYKKKDVEAKMLFCFPSIKSRLFFKKV